MDSHGVLKVMDVPAFVAPKHQHSGRTLIEEYSEILGTPQLPVTTRDWPKITRSVKFQTYFVLSAANPSLEASIRFDTTGSTEGVYDLKIPSKQLIERGSIVSVKSIPVDDSSQHPFTGLQDYPVRFFVKTSANDRQGTERVWLIGITTFTEADAAEESANSERPQS
jgi:hypothetical protein